MCLYKIIFQTHEENEFGLSLSVFGTLPKRKLWAVWAFEFILTPDTQCMMYKNIYPPKTNQFCR